MRIQFPSSSPSNGAALGGANDSLPKPKFKFPSKLNNGSLGSASSLPKPTFTFPSKLNNGSLGSASSLPKPTFTFPSQIKGGFMGTKLGGEKEQLATDSAPKIMDAETATLVSNAADSLKSMGAGIPQVAGTSNITLILPSVGKKQRTYRNKKRRAKKTGRKI
jgi:hypothetical protein